MTDKAAHVVIVGAPRSGTNILRDFLCSAADVATWPCDEINYIWRYGNARYPSDAFTPDMASPKIREYIQRRFHWVSQRYGASTVVEKTCANSLRVDYVDAVLESPRYVFIVRNGYDASFSAMKRWRASLDLTYLLKKARFVPPADLPFYAARYFWSRASRLISTEKRLSTWGPRLPEMASLAGKLSLPEICASQWKECVDRSLDAFDKMKADRILRIRYESLATAPQEEALRLAAFLDIDAEELLKSPLLARIRSDSIGTAEAGLDATAMAAIRDIIEPTMQRLDYS